MGKPTTTCCMPVFLWPCDLCLSVCLGHRQLAEGEHRDPGQISSLCAVRPRRGEILQLPCPLLQFGRCRRAIWPDWGHHCWRQAWSENTNTHHNGSNVRFSVNDAKKKVKCPGPQISHQPQAKLSQPETRTHQSSCLGKRPVTPKSWWDTTSRGLWWAATCGSHATTSL